MKAYLATHFFDKFGYEGTIKLAEELRTAFPELDLYNPLENGDINDKETNDSTITDVAIYQADRDKLLSSQILIACIDGVEIDSGVAGEIGMFIGSLETLKALNIKHTPKLIIGLYTDIRRDGTGDNRMYKNLFIKGGINEWGFIAHNTKEIVKGISSFISGYPI